MMPKRKLSVRASRKPLPAQVLDHATGYLLAFAVMAALVRRAEEGGSWHVRVSLAQTGHWLRQLGRIDGMACPDPGFRRCARLPGGESPPGSAG